MPHPVPIVLRMDKTPPIPKRLKQARLRAGLSQRGLGIAAGLDEFSASARINQYERGKHTPDFRTVERLAKVLGYPTAYFYTREDDLAEVIMMLERLPAREKQKLLVQLRRKSPRTTR